MATAIKHKKRSSRAYQQRPNFERYFFANAQRLYERNFFKMFKNVVDVSEMSEEETENENV